MFDRHIQSSQGKISPPLFARHNLVKRAAASCLAAVFAVCTLAAMPISVAAQTAPPSGPTYPNSHAELKLLYATTRLNENQGGGRPQYGGARHLDFGQGSTEYGTAVIERPAGYQTISLSPSWMELRGQMTAADNYFLAAQVTKLKRQSQADFMDQIRNFHGLIAIYVHGYDMTFDNCIQEMAELVQEYQARSPNTPILPIVFSWPSPANKADYSGDEASLEWSEKPFREMVQEIARTKSDDTNIDLIAHSMGSRYAFAFAHSQLQCAENNVQVKPIFRNIFLSCSDMDYHTAEAQRDSLQNCVSKMVYVFVNDNDGALFTSQMLHRAPRLGRPIDPGDDATSGSLANVGQPATSMRGSGLLAQAQNMLQDKAVAMFGQKARNLVEDLTGSQTVFTRTIPAQSADVALWLKQDPYLSRDWGPKARLIDSTGFVTLNMGHSLVWPLLAGLMMDQPQDSPFVFGPINKRPDQAMLKVMGGVPTYLWRYDRIDLSRLNH